MSFSSELSSLCKSYAEFSYNGYAIQIPYYLSGKNTPDEVKAAIANWAGTSPKTQAEIQKYVTDHPSTVGVDCSGLVYYVLNEASGGAVRKYFEEQLGGNLIYKNGILAANLTDTAHGSKLTEANAVKPGCVMRSQDGKHVLVIHSVTRTNTGTVTSIGYTHSNVGTGPHYGSITIGDPMKDLNDKMQTWHDSAYTDATAKSLYNYTLLLKPLANAL